LRVGELRKPARGKVEIPSVMPVDWKVENIHLVWGAFSEFYWNFNVGGVVYRIPIVEGQLRQRSSKTVLCPVTAHDFLIFGKSSVELSGMSVIECCIHLATTV
jgi:hypothetical protein